MLLYYITDRTQFPGSEHERCDRLLDKIADAARWGIDFVQLREKDLSSQALELLATKAVELVRLSGGKTRLLINSRPDVALAVGADGVHLRSRDISPADVKAIWCAAGHEVPPFTAVSCHTETEVVAAAEAGADFAVFGPIFGKQNMSNRAVGLDSLRSASQHKIPVLALGWITEENAGECLEADAAGIAAVRLFQQTDIKTVVGKLRALSTNASR